MQILIQKVCYMSLVLILEFSYFTKIMTYHMTMNDINHEYLNDSNIKSIKIPV